MVQGFINGIENMFGSVASAAWNMVQSLGGAVLKVLGIGSPSKVARFWGQMTGEGLVQGLLGHSSAVQSAAQQMAQQVGVGLNRGVRGGVPLGITTSVNATAAMAASGGSGNIVVQCDGRTLFTIMQSQMYKYNIRNSGTVTGVLKPVGT
jgi:hypothetical protein